MLTIYSNWKAMHSSMPNGNHLSCKPGIGIYWTTSNSYKLRRDRPLTYRNPLRIDLAALNSFFLLSPY